MRLGFAVAAHLEPEILIVDEVLAVGDAGVPARSASARWETCRGQGRTVLFVSHNMAAIGRLLPHESLWLDRGGVRIAGKTCEAKASAGGTKLFTPAGGSPRRGMRFSIPASSRRAISAAISARPDPIPVKWAIASRPCSR